MISVSQNKGITLIETIIAVSILALGIVGVLQAFPLGAHLAKTAQMSTIAAELGQAKIEQELSGLYDDVPISNTTEDYDSITNFSAYKRITQIDCVRASDLAAISCDYDLILDPSPMKKITVTVYWRSTLGLAEKNISLLSLMVKK
ncbi:MAG: prepilin-type N-terminal cleavage/methylation domain-containing protein [Candidatus Nealsonbacteria bacterium]